MSSTHASATTAKRRLLALIYGVLCHGLFALAVSVMIYEMAFGLSRAQGILQGPWRWIGNGLLLLQFPLAHSFLLSGRGRALLRGLAPAGLGTDLSTTSYVIVASLQIFLLFGFWSPSGIIWWQAEGWMLVMMIALYTAGWLLLLKSMFDAGITLQTGALGWWAFSRLPPADLRFVRNHALDGAGLDAGSIRAGDRAVGLLRGGTPAEGSALHADVRQ